MPTNFLSQSTYESVLPWVVLVILLGLFVLVGPKASANDAKLKNDAGYKRPMLAFELNAGEASNMFVSWDETTKGELRAALLWDYLFIFIYPAVIATLCFIAARYLEVKEILAFNYGLIIIFLQLVAATSDAIENFALLKVLHGQTENLWPQLARWCAILKFGLIAVGLLYSVVLGGGAWIVTFIGKIR